MQEKNNHSKPDKLRINDLYPDLTEAEQAKAEYYLTGYIEVVRRIGCD